jgi:pyridinium-3,5-bisthiocarboxylic acid mononucleotide nickel chelatase
MHIHLDAIGGISGNMFVAALLELWPQHVPVLAQQLARAGFADMFSVTATPKHDGVLQGTYFSVTPKAQTKSGAKVFKAHATADAHTRWSEISALITDSALGENVKTHALGIFTLLAEAEAAVHGIDVDDVEFHEVGAWDSIADIVCAAVLIEAGGATSWSVSRLPLGNGQVKTAHGMLPLPAPAVTQLLKGYQFHDDGREGERVTPTGAAILRYLRATHKKPAANLCLQNSGTGFGSRIMPGISNVLRALLFSEDEDNHNSTSDEVAVLSFEVDDQSAEDLSLALEQLRNYPGVIDIVHYPVFGKKNRMTSSIRVLAYPEAQSEVEELCFTQTSTLGIRCQILKRAVLRRQIDIVELDGRTYRVKLALRPDGELTAKAELDDLAQASLNQAERRLVRDAVEAIAIERHSDVMPASFGKRTAARPMAPLMDKEPDEDERELDDDDDDYDP